MPIAGVETNMLKADNLNNANNAKNANHEMLQAMQVSQPMRTMRASNGCRASTSLSPRRAAHAKPKAPMQEQCMPNACKMRILKQ